MKHIRLSAIVAAFVFAFGTLTHDVVVTVNPAATGGTPTACRVYLGNVLQGTGAAADRACGTPLSFPNLLTANGVYVFNLTSVNTFGESPKSVNYTVNIGTPPNAPSGVVTVTCTPSPCPVQIIVN